MDSSSRLEVFPGHDLYNGTYAAIRHRGPAPVRHQAAGIRPDLRTLRLFVAVCEEESIAKAADREHIAPSAASKRIADLEYDLQTSLFERHSRGLEPLPPAYLLLHHARSIMENIAAIDRDLGDWANGLRSTVRIHSSVSAIVQHLPDDLKAFLSLHPTIRVELEEAVSQNVVRAVAENTADIGIFGSTVSTAGVEVLPYRTDRLVALMPFGHILSSRPWIRLQDLLPYDFIGPQRGSSLDSLVNMATAELVEPLRMRIRVNGFETVCSMVQANFGVGLVPEHCAERYVAAHHLAAVRLAEPWAERKWKLCVRTLASLSVPARLLADHLGGL
jgi:DNA-binding transcriptional LysR family regulator